MVEICRCAKASFSVSLTTWRLTPSWPARCRLMSSGRAQAAVLGLRRDVAEQRDRGAVRPPDCWPTGSPARHRCRSACTGTASGSTGSISAHPAPAGNRSSCPGSTPSAPSGAAITAETSSRRSPRGFSVITRRPTLVVGLTDPAPITETTPVTSGSALIASAALLCRPAFPRTTRRDRPGSPP